LQEKIRSGLERVEGGGGWQSKAPERDKDRSGNGKKKRCALLPEGVGRGGGHRMRAFCGKKRYEKSDVKEGEGMKKRPSKGGGRLSEASERGSRQLKMEREGRKNSNSCSFSKKGNSPEN